MPTVPTLQLLADAVLLLHFAVVAFVVGGLLMIYVGNAKGWSWVNNARFRFLHLITITFVIVQSWLGKDCPLTVLEVWLRERAGQASYQTTFIEHWVQAILYYQAPLWVFTLIYSIFGLLVAATWWYFPPTRRNNRGTHSAA